MTPDEIVRYVRDRVPSVTIVSLSWSSDEWEVCIEHGENRFLISAGSEAYGRSPDLLRAANDAIEVAGAPPVSWANRFGQEPSEGR